MNAAEKLGETVSVKQACQALGVSRATLYRHRNTSETPSERLRSNPSQRALSPQERAHVHDTLHSEQFMDQSPREVYATLLDEGIYLCSVRTMYRILNENAAVKERRNQRKHLEYKKPELLATGPNQVWSWDITKLLGPQKWTYYYLYVLLDIYSRHTVGWMLAHRECSSLASKLIRETIEKQGVSEDQLTLHSDRGPSMTSHGVAQLLGLLGVTKSHSRPHVSNDNPFSESQFKTLKYRHEFPNRFGSYEDAHSYCGGFFAWYNDEHYHTGIGLLTPSMLHYGAADNVLAARHEVMQSAYAQHPNRFVQGCPKVQTVPSAVWINPPMRSTHDDKKRPPEANCPQRPDASLTHPRLGYPLSSCVPAELESVSPSNAESNGVHGALQPPLNTRAIPEKIPGGWGLAPDDALKSSATERSLQ